MHLELAKVTKDDLVVALSSERCNTASEQIFLPLHVLDELNYLTVRISRSAGAQVESLRQAQVTGAVSIMLATARRVKPRHWGLAVGFGVAERWLANCKALLPAAVTASWGELVAGMTAAGADPVAVAAAAMDPIVADPLTVFVAGPVTGATIDETEALVATTTRLRAELVQLRVRLYSAPEESDPRVHREFADDERWRDVDEHWIRRADLVVILHPRAATGLGVVHEIAVSACVPVLLVADQPVTPMVVRTMTPERLLDSHDVVDNVVEYIETHGQQMLQRRRDVRAVAAGPWRKGRMRLRRDIEALADESITAWTPSTITRERIHEVTSDDYAFGSLTEFERMQLRQAFQLPKVRPLKSPERRALEQAVRNNRWTREDAWAVELAGRELLADASGTDRHLAHPHYPSFWEALHRDLRS